MDPRTGRSVRRSDRLRDAVGRIEPVELEEHGWWEHSIWAVLAGAMTESGSELTYSSLQTNYLFNSNWVTSIFDPVDSHPTV